jgi:hypothetical protein
MTSGQTISISDQIFRDRSSSSPDESMAFETHRRTNFRDHSENSSIFVVVVVAFALEITTDNFAVQVSLVIRGRYVLSFWTANLEFADKKSIFDWKIVILNHISNVNKRICR